MSDDGPLGVTRQEKDCRELATALGAEVTQVYRENDTSAFRRRKVTLPDGRTAMRVVRPEFRRALDDLAGGVIDILIVYDIDRLARDPRDLEDLIDVVEETGRSAKAVTGSLDLSTDHGIAMARVQVAIANKSSRDTARRVRRKQRDLAEEGRVGQGGNRPYGYEANRTVVIEEEAAVVREIAARVIAGDSLTSVAAALNRRGVRPVRAAAWDVTAVRQVVVKPHGTGLRVYQGKVIGEGTWRPILDRPTWQAFRDIVAARSRDTPAVRKYLLSGIALCGLCGTGRMGANSDSDGVRYRCQELACGRISRDMRLLDEHVIGRVLGRLAEEGLTPGPDDDAPAAGELAGLQARRRAVVAAFADVDGEDPVELRSSLRDLDGRITGLVDLHSRRLRERRLADARGMSRVEWDALPLDRRRAIVAGLYLITVHRARRGRGFDPASVEMERVE